eukprot:1105503-Amphidinium_carterae.1
MCCCYYTLWPNTSNRYCGSCVDFPHLQASASHLQTLRRVQASANASSYQQAHIHHQQVLGCALLNLFL